MSEQIPEVGEHPIDPQRPQAGDNLKYPQSVSDPPEPEPQAQDDSPAVQGGGAVPVLGYDVLEAKEEAVILAAKLCHAVVEAMNKEHNETTLDWADSRDSCIAGVRRVLDNPGETAEQNHEAWMKYRAGEGWVYGPIKDAKAKTHPCMVPYDALGPYQRSKDAVFHAIVRTLFGV